MQLHLRIQCRIRKRSKHFLAGQGDLPRIPKVGDGMIKNMFATKHYALWICISTVFVFVTQYSKMEVLLDYILVPRDIDCSVITHQPNLTDATKGTIVVCNPLSEKSTFKNWSIKFKLSEEDAAIKFCKTSVDSGEVTIIRKEFVITPEKPLALNPGLALQLEYELNKGRIEDIIFSAEDFATSLSKQEKHKKARKDKADTFKAIITLLPTIVLLRILLYKNKQIGMLEIGIHQALKRNKCLEQNSTENQK